MVNKQLKTNREHIVTIDNDRFLINGIVDSETDLKLTVERITFNLNSTTNNDDIFFIASENQNSLTYEASGNNNILNYYLAGVEYTVIDHYRDNYNNGSTRAVAFEPKKSGTYFYKSLNQTNNNKGGTIQLLIEMKLF